MIDITILRAMAAAGATVEMILAAVEAAQAAQKQKLIDRRAKDAERQRRKRSRGVTPSHADSRGPSDAVCDTNAHIDTSLEPKKEINQGRKKVSIPADWVLSSEGFEYASAKGWEPSRIESEAERFKNHFLASAEPKKDWAATWRNWVTSPYQKTNGVRAGPGGVPRPGSREDRQERTDHALSKLRNFVNGHHPDDAPGGGEAGEPPAGLLPFNQPPRS